MKASTFILNIYAPGSVSEVLAHFEADQPFAAISVGDLIAGETTGEGEPVADSSNGRPLRVATIMHSISDSPTGICHNVLVYTITVPS